MKKLSIVLLALMLGLGLTGEAGAQKKAATPKPESPPSYGTVNGNTWSNYFDSFQPHFTYTITPVPSMLKLENEKLLVLSNGSKFTLSGKSVGYQIYTITEWDDSEMGEHGISSSPIFSGGPEKSYTFNNSGRYLVCFINTSTNSTMTMLTVEVSGAASGKTQ